MDAANVGGTLSARSVFAVFVIALALLLVWLSWAAVSLGAQGTEAEAVAARLVESQSDDPEWIGVARVDSANATPIGLSSVLPPRFDFDVDVTATSKQGRSIRGTVGAGLTRGGWVLATPADPERQ